VRVFSGGGAVAEIRQFVLAHCFVGAQYLARSKEIVLLDEHVASTGLAPFRPADAALRDRLNAGLREACGYQRRLRLTAD